jgi:hypothetical protein
MDCSKRIVVSHPLGASGAHRSPAALKLFAAATAFIFTLLLLFGAFRLLRRRDIAVPGTALLLLAAATYMLVVKSYDYGAYKILSSGWYLFALMVAEGTFSIAALLPRKPYSWLVALAPIAPQAILLSMQLQRFDAATRIKNMAYYRQVTEIDRIIGKDPVLVVVEDEQASGWLTLFLRDRVLVPIKLTQPYLRWSTKYEPVVRLRSQLDARATLLLTDDKAEFGCHGYILIWQGGAYRLWRPSDVNPKFAAELVGPEAEQLLTRQACR